jgi:hypothetical protein
MPADDPIPVTVNVDDEESVDPPAVERAYAVKLLPSLTIEIVTSVIADNPVLPSVVATPPTTPTKFQVAKAPAFTRYT